jgi:hypothetical protein
MISKKDFKSADQQSEKRKEENEYKVFNLLKSSFMKLYSNGYEKLIREQLLL